MSLPTWAPTLVQVASIVPARAVVAGLGTFEGTFTAATNPTADQVTQNITDACAWVSVKTGDVHDSLATMAAATAATYAAAIIERGFPDRNADVDTAGLLYAQALAMRADLDGANRALTGADVTDPVGALPVLGVFPPPVAWGDLLL